MTPPQATAYSWRSPGQTGMAHAYPRHGRGPALCGARNQDPRFDWPKCIRCAICVDMAGGQAR